MRATSAKKGHAERRAAEHAARREHRRLSREKLVELQRKLRDARNARSRGMKELAIACRAERLTLRAQLRQMRAKALVDIRERAQEARRAAHAACVAKKKEARETCDTAIAYARAAAAAERQRDAEEQRITQEQTARIASVEHAHDKGAVHHHTMRSAMLGQLGPLFERVRSAAPGESRAEAVLRYAEAHPDQAHAIVEPAVERAIADTKAKIARIERSADAPTATQLAHAHRSHLARKKQRVHRNVRLEHEAERQALEATKVAAAHEER